MVGSAYTGTSGRKRQSKKPSHLLRKWTVQRKPAQLGSLDKGGICDLYVSAEVKLLRDGRGVTIRSDHLPLKKFLNKQTMNSKVNNWAVELEQFRLHLEWIPGTRNLLVDSLSRLLDIVPDAQKTKEPDDQELGSYCFKELEPAKVMEKVSTEVIELTDNSKYQNYLQESQKTLDKPGVKENSTDKKKMQDTDSEFPEHSQNSRKELAV